MPSTTTTTPRALPDGVYVPVVTFFKNTPAQELDLEAFAAHIEWLGQAGVQGIVVQGSTGEAVTLSREERNALTAAARKSLNNVSNPGPVITGTVGAQSTAQAIQYCQDAAANGAEYTLVLPPAYYATALTNASILQFYLDVASASPIPILIYSYPAVSGGIDMDSDLLSEIAKHPNVVGCKHTDHNLGKQARMASLTAEGAFGTYSTLGGASDYLLSTLSVGGNGCITGMANATPRAVLKCVELYRAGSEAEARKLGGEIARGEWALGKGGLTGTKYATVHWGAHLPRTASHKCRDPVPAVSDTTKGWVEEELKRIVAIERGLEKGVTNGHA